MKTLTLRLLAIAAILVPANTTRAQQEKRADSYEEALARYKETRVRIPFQHHTEGRLTLAQTKDPRALQILVEDYQKSKQYPEYTRYTIARMLEMHFDREDAVPALDALRTANATPTDAWMWVHTLKTHADRVGDADAVEIATTAKSMLQRACAILALGESRNGRIKDAIVRNCVEFPKKDSDRALLLGAMSGTLWELKRQVNDADYRAAIEAYINLLSPDVGLDHTMQVQMARHLQWILKGPALFTTPEPWLEILSRGELKTPPKTETRAGSRFFGVETDGERFVYVVDMSNSMLKPISPDAKPQGPLTGPKVKKKKGAILDEEDIPWNKITSRWDLAREQVRVSLSRLTDDKYFAVVVFGDNAEVLDATKGLVKATRGNINKAMAELDEVKIGPKDPTKAPDGVLKGETNMHAGLRVAFGLTRKGFVQEAAYVDGDVLTEGCDTIFLLSDGAPSRDEFREKDKDYGEGQVVQEHEYGAAANRTPELWYDGPYVHDDWLVEDVRRMNAFRRIRMHCVGLGEANMKLLGRLAEMGHGEAFAVGQKK